MTDTLTSWLSATDLPNSLYVAALLTAVAIITTLTLTARSIIRQQRARYRSLDELHTTLLRRHLDLMARTPGTVGYKLSDDDRELLESVAVEIAGELNECNLIDAEWVSAATIPAPTVEVGYPDYTVSLTLSLDRHPPEEDDDDEGEADELETAAATP